MCWTDWLRIDKWFWNSSKIWCLYNFVLFSYRPFSRKLWQIKTEIDMYFLVRMILKKWLVCLLSLKKWNTNLGNFIPSHVNIKQFLYINFAEAGSWDKDIRQAKTSLELTAHCIIHWHTKFFSYHMRPTIYVKSLLLNVRSWSILHKISLQAKEVRKLFFFFLHLQPSCRQQYSLVCIHSLNFVRTLKGQCLVQQAFC